MFVWLKDRWEEELGEKKNRVSTERSRSDPHRSFDSPFLMSRSFLREGPQIVRYRLCNSQRRVIDGNWKRRRAANGKGDFLPGQVNFKDTSWRVTPTTRDSTPRWLFCYFKWKLPIWYATRTNKVNSRIGIPWHHLKCSFLWNYLKSGDKPIVEKYRRERRSRFKFHDVCPSVSKR